MVKQNPPRPLVDIPPNSFWLPEDVKSLKAATTFQDLLDLALLVAGRMPKDPPLALICGPQREGVKTIRKAMNMVVEKCDSNVFDDTVFDEKMTEIFQKQFGGKDMRRAINDLLQEFYGPLISTSISFLILLPCWKKCVVSRWKYYAFYKAQKQNGEPEQKRRRIWHTLPIGWESKFAQTIPADAAIHGVEWFQ